VLLTIRGWVFTLTFTYSALTPRYTIMGLSNPPTAGASIPSAPTSHTITIPDVTLSLRDRYDSIYILQWKTESNEDEDSAKTSRDVLHTLNRFPIHRNECVILDGYTVQEEGLTDGTSLHFVRKDALIGPTSTSTSDESRVYGVTHDRHVQKMPRSFNLTASSGQRSWHKTGGSDHVSWPKGEDGQNMKIQGTVTLTCSRRSSDA
jgi:hypothetical protein